MERISGVKIMKTKTFTKILSGILCSALTMQIGWGIKTKSVNAASVTSTETSDGAIVNITGGQAYEAFDFKADSDGGIVISYTDDADNAQTYLFEKISVLNTYESVQMNIQSDITIDNLVITDGTFVGIDGNCSFTCSKIDSNGWTQIIVEPGSTFNCGSIEKADGTRFILTNNSSVIIDSVDLSVIEYPASDTSTISVLSSFTNGSDDVPGTVIADRYTNISNNGGKFTLQVGEATKEISETISNKKPNELFDDPFSFGTVSDLYYGQDYDFSSLITVADGYNGTVTLEYSYNGSDYSTDKPTYVGDYYVRVTATDSGSFLGKTTSSQSYSIDFVTPDELGLSAPYVSVSGVVNGKYIPAGLTLTAPEGLLLGSTTISGVDGFANTLTLTADQIMNDYGEINADLGIVFRSASGAMKDATTDDITLITAYPDIVNLIFDKSDPYVDVQFVDGRETSFEEGEDVFGDEAEIVVFDENLHEIYVNGELYGSYKEGQFNEDSEDFEDYEVTLTLESTPGELKDYEIKAVDYSGRETTLSFAMVPSITDTDAVLKIPETIYAGDDYDIEVITKSKGDVTFKYTNAATGTALSGKPVNAGSYKVTATVAETDFYNETSATATYSIVKRTPEVELSIPSVIKLGETYSPVITTDSDATAVIEYKAKDAADSAYSTVKPSATGSYTVRVTLRETDKYESAVATADFSISKTVPTAIIEIGNPYAGTDYKPSVKTNSDSAADAIFEYKAKNAPDSAYSTVAPKTPGTYNVRVTLRETNNFAQHVASTEFSIVYLEAPAVAYTMTGTKGKNDFFTSDVELKAPDGYKISSVYGRNYENSIPYTDKMSSVYLMRTSDNALTGAIALKTRPQIDADAPAFKTTAGTVKPGDVLYTSSYVITVDDPNLRTLTVNGEPINLKAAGGNVLTLSPGFGIVTYKIVAEDAAGNKNTVEFTLKAEWLESRIVIPDVVLPLESNESYNLGDGYWLVTRNTPEGPVTDNTVYSGNMPFYVNEGGDYTFTRVI